MEMQTAGVQPDLKVYSALIAGFSQVGDHQRAQQLKEVGPSILSLAPSPRRVRC
jgi:hypothetical protein